MTATTFDPIAVGSEIQRRLGVKTSRDEPLARFTTMRVGGPADLFAIARNPFELRGLVRFAAARAIPLTILGRGSNVVISDAGIRGLVVQVRAEAVSVEGDRLVADAGVAMARAATVSADAGLSGLEFGLAIPGSVGGAVWANAGAHGADVAAVLDSVVLLTTGGSEVRVEPADLELGYRTSRLKADPSTVVVGATFRLAAADPAAIRAGLDDIRRWRQAHQPLGLPSAGSVFRNPPTGPSAGELIDAVGLKGGVEGGATVSFKHANFIVNDRRGTAADVRRLGDRVRDRVAASTGTWLDYEIAFVGDWTGWPIAERRDRP